VSPVAIFISFFAVFALGVVFGQFLEGRRHITGIRLRRVKDYAVVDVEARGEWFEAIEEHVEKDFDHFITASGLHVVTHGGKC
jgi:hypothetical protein